MRDTGELVSVGDSAIVSVLTPAAGGAPTTAPKVRCELKPPGGEPSAEWPTWAPHGAKAQPSGAKLTKKMFKYTSVALKPRSPLCFAGCSTGAVHAWDTDTRELIRVFGGHTDTVTCISLAGDGVTMVTGSADATVRVWDLLRCSSNSVSFPQGVHAVAACPTSPFAVVGLSDGSVWTLDLVSRATKNLGQHHDRVRGVEFAPSGVSAHFLTASLFVRRLSRTRKRSHTHTHARPVSLCVRV